MFWRSESAKILMCALHVHSFNEIVGKRELGYNDVRSLSQVQL